MKRLLPMFIALCMLFFTFGGFTAFAQTKEMQEGAYTFSVLNNEATISRADKSLSDAVTVPDTLGGYPVTVIGDNAFEDCIKMTSVTLPEGVRHMGSEAFAYCDGLKSATAPETLKTAGANTFLGCSQLKKVELPSVTDLPNGIFEDCASLTDCNLSIHLTSIGNGAFVNCRSLKGLGFYESLSRIGDHAFLGCEKLESTDFGYYQYIGSYCFKDCTSLAAPTIPRGFVSMGVGAFEGCTALESIGLDFCFLTVVPGRAFAGCTSLRHVTLPLKTDCIGENAFLGCEKLMVSKEGSDELHYKIRMGDSYKLITNKEWRYMDQAVSRPSESTTSSDEGSKGEEEETGEPYDLPMILTVSALTLAAVAGAVLLLIKKK